MQTYQKSQRSYFADIMIEILRTIYQNMYIFKNEHNSSKFTEFVSLNKFENFENIYSWHFFCLKVRRNFLSKLKK